VEREKGEDPGPTEGDRLVPAGPMNLIGACPMHHEALSPTNSARLEHHSSPERGGVLLVILLDRHPATKSRSSPVLVHPATITEQVTKIRSLDHPGQNEPLGARVSALALSHPVTHDRPFLFHRIRNRHQTELTAARCTQRIGDPRTTLALQGSCSVVCATGRAHPPLNPSTTEMANCIRCACVPSMIVYGKP